MDDNALYFASPKEAVAKISRLLKDESWQELSRYYDLGESDVDPEELTSGRFFIRRQRPQAAHPGGFWKYKHPFPPGFSYDYHQETDGNTIVHLSIRIDQGGGMVQEGRHSFMMRKSHRGYRILPTAP